MIMAYAEVIGDPIAHSKSPLIHNFWIEKLGLEARYGRCHVRAEELADYLAGRRRDPAWRGCNVTIPHKERAAELVDGLWPGTPDLGAINTIISRDGMLLGANTDVEGVVGPLNDWLDHITGQGANSPSPIFAAVIGAGGAARAAVWGLAHHRRRPRIMILARRPDQAQALLDQCDASGSVKAIATASLEGVNVLINASPLGMDGYPPLPLSLEAFDTRPALVFDMVYAPVRTPLLIEAEERRIDVIDGLTMLTAQAGSAFQHFFGQAPPKPFSTELRALLTS